MQTFPRFPTFQSKLVQRAIQFVALDIFPAITSCNVEEEIIASSGEPAAALLCVLTHEKFICRWELGQKSAVSAVFIVLSSAMFT